MTYTQAAKAAIQVQDACNLTGVVRSFGEAMTAVRAYANEHGHGTDWINQHPVAVLFADKLADLTGRPDFERYALAMGLCRDLSACGDCGLSPCRCCTVCGATSAGCTCGGQAVRR